MHQIDVNHEKWINCYAKIEKKKHEQNKRNNKKTRMRYILWNWVWILICYKSTFIYVEWMIYVDISFKRGRMEGKLPCKQMSQKPRANKSIAPRSYQDYISSWNVAIWSRGKLQEFHQFQPQQKRNTTTRSILTSHLLGKRKDMIYVKCIVAGAFVLCQCDYWVVEWCSYDNVLVQEVISW